MDWKEQLGEIKNTMIEREEVFEAVRRGNHLFEDASNLDILNHFDLASAEELQGHVNNTKGILFEQEFQDKLEAAGVESNIHFATNHPDTDIQILDDGSLIEEIQLKATDSTSYINDALAENPDILVVATSEAANDTYAQEVLDSGISNTVLEEAVIETISPIPVSIDGAVFRVGLALLTGGLFF